MSSGNISDTLSVDIDRYMVNSDDNNKVSYNNNSSLHIYSAYHLKGRVLSTVLY